MANPAGEYKRWKLGCYTDDSATRWWFAEHESGQWETPRGFTRTRAELEHYIDVLEVPR